MKILKLSIVILITASYFDGAFAMDPAQMDEMRKMAHQAVKKVTDTFVPLAAAATILVDYEERNARTQGTNGVPLTIQSGSVPAGPFMSEREVKTKLVKVLTRVTHAYGLEAQCLGQQLSPKDQALADAFLQNHPANDGDA